MESVNPPKVARGLAAPAVKLDEAGLIAEDLPCRHCGYNLRTLSPAVQCPECGTSVGRSVHGDYLRYADPAWVRGLATGAMLLLVAIVLQVLLAGVITGLVMIQDRFPKWTIVLDIAINFMGGIGFWLMTAADPGSTEILGRQSLRKTARIFLILWFCLAMSGPLRRGSIAVVHYSTDILNLAISIGFAVAMLSCVKALVRRIPDASLGKSCHRFAVFLIATKTYRVTADSIWIFGAGSSFVTGSRTFMLYLGILLIVIRTVWAIRLTIRLNSAFLRAAQLARDTCRAFAPRSSPTEGGIP